LPASPPPPQPLPPPQLSHKASTSTGAATISTSAPEPPSHHDDPPAPLFEPVYYFFYGTLTKPDVLKGVLSLTSEPLLLPAKIYGYELANWGQYRTLVDGNPGAEVVGCASLVQSAEHESRLAYYETNAYAVAACKIHFLDGGLDPVEGRTFKYAGDAEALKAGRFDRTLWERQMGQRLPSRWRGVDLGEAGQKQKDKQDNEP
jgi:hypothetical protein